MWMRDPATLSIPIFRLFGVTIRLHLFYVLTLFVWFRLLYNKVDGISAVELFAFVVLLPLPFLLIHEWGHIGAARMLDGEVEESTIWPLGGLTYPEMPFNPRSNVIVGLAGPIVTLLVCMILYSVSIGAGYTPKIGFLADPFSCPSKLKDTDQIATVESRPLYFLPGPAEPGISNIVMNPKFNEQNEAVAPDNENIKLSRNPILPTYMAWVWRALWLNFWLLVVNIGFFVMPFDMGQVVFKLLSDKFTFFENNNENDDENAEEITSSSKRFVIFNFISIIYVALLIITGLIINESLLPILAIIIVVYTGNAIYNLSLNSSDTQDESDSSFGYDFSEGYRSLEKSENEIDFESNQTEKLSFWEKRKRAKEAEKIRKQAEQDQRDAQRVDDLLDKIQKHGKSILTPEERQFLDRMSARYRDMP